MDRRSVTTALAGALLALVVVGGFLALDRTVLHWYSASSDAAAVPKPAPAFIMLEVMQITQSRIAQDSFPRDTNWVDCNGASYRSQNQTWVVTCEFSGFRNELVENRITSVPYKTTRTYVFDDETGRVVR